MKRTTALAMVLCPLIVAACTPGNDNDTGLLPPDAQILDANPDIATNDAADDIPDVMGDAGHDEGGQTTDPGDDEGEQELCYDYVCPFYDYACADQTTYYGVEFFEVEPDCPWACGGDWGNKCPEGTWCYSTGEFAPDYGWESRDYPCRAVDCNASEGPSCGDGLFCDTFPGDCNGPGVCADASRAEHLTGAEGELDYVCGCDGVTYKGWKARATAGVAAAHTGPCCDPATLDFSLENSEGNAVFLVCVKGGLPAEVPGYITEMLAAAKFGTEGAAVTCAQGESAYVGDLVLTDTGAIDAAQFTALCELATLEQISGVSGHPAGFCETLPCFDSRMCVDLYCQSPCGCCDCVTGSIRCLNERETIRCVKQGCWIPDDDCTGFLTCVTGENDSGCALSCDLMKNSLKLYVNQWFACDTATDCRVLPGFCDPADGPCWMPWSCTDTSCDQGMASFQADWATAGCGDVQTCGCGAEPGVDCIAGTCRLVE